MKKFPAALCQGRDGRKYLGVYSFNHDVYIKPSWNMSGLERIAHISYSKGKRKGGVDYFLITGNRDVSEDVKIKKTISTNNENVRIISEEEGVVVLPKQSLNTAEEYYDIQTEILSIPGEMQDEVLDFARADVKDFCAYEFALSRRRGSRIKTVDKIIPKTRIKRINPEKVLTGGKQEFIDECILEANIDFGKGCISGWVPGEGGGSFDGKFFHNFFTMSGGECHYCYAERHHKSFPKTIYEFNRERLKSEMSGQARLVFDSKEPLGHPVKTLRFGKRTEAWTPFTQNEFMQTLEVMQEVGTRGVIPTKLMPFRQDIAELLKKTKSSAPYSVGFNKFEPGALAYGSTNQWRLEQAMKYREAGVNSNIYLMIIGHMPLTKREKEVLEFADYGKKIPIQLLPIRFKGKDLVRQMTGGQEWDELCDCTEQQVFAFAESPYRGSYSKQSQSILCEKIHPDWLKLIGDNKGRIRMCHHNSEAVYCGGCYQAQGGIYPVSK